MQLRNRLDVQLRNVCLIFRVKASGPPGPPLHPPCNPWNIQPSQETGQGVSMTFNAASRLRSLEDRSAALGSSRCELPGMHSVPKSAVLPYASGVGGLSRRLLNIYCLSAWKHLQTLLRMMWDSELCWNHEYEVSQGCKTKKRRPRSW